MEHIWCQEVFTTLISLPLFGEKITTLCFLFEFLSRALVPPIIAAHLATIPHGIMIGINCGAKLVVGIRTAITTTVIASVGEEVYNLNLSVELKSQHTGFYLIIVTS
jgi:hypothetical protein